MNLDVTHVGNGVPLTTTGPVGFMPSAPAAPMPASSLPSKPDVNPLAYPVDPVAAGMEAQFQTWMSKLAEATRHDEFVSALSSLLILAQVMTNNGTNMYALVGLSALWASKRT